MPVYSNRIVNIETVIDFIGSDTSVLPFVLTGRILTNWIDIINRMPYSDTGKMAKLSKVIDYLNSLVNHGCLVIDEEKRLSIFDNIRSMKK